jgi:hypothetical protein
MQTNSGLVKLIEDFYSEPGVNKGRLNNYLLAHYASNKHLTNFQRHVDPGLKLGNDKKTIIDKLNKCKGVEYRRFFEEVHHIFEKRGFSNNLYSNFNKELNNLINSSKPSIEALILSYVNNKVEETDKAAFQLFYEVFNSGLVNSKRIHYLDRVLDFLPFQSRAEIANGLEDYIRDHVNELNNNFYEDTRAFITAGGGERFIVYGAILTGGLYLSAELASPWHLIAALTTIIGYELGRSYIVKSLANKKAKTIEINESKYQALRKFLSV